MVDGINVLVIILEANITCSDITYFSFFSYRN